MKIRNSGSEVNRGLVTCVRLSKDTRDRLAQLGSKDQTFDDIINVAIDQTLDKKCVCEDELAHKMSGKNGKFS